MTDKPPGLPVVAVGGIAFDEAGRVLLVQRGKPPARGKWSIPGGRVELGERMVDACAREMKEETGLLVQVGDMVEVIDKIGRAGQHERDPVIYHFVIVDFLVTVVGGDMRPADDASDARWVDERELQALPLTEGLLPVLARARRMHGHAGG